MSELRAVILDIDGTLLLSNDAHARAFIDAAAILGIDGDFGRTRSLIGKGSDKLIPEAFGFELHSDLGKQLEELKGKVFTTRYLPTLQPAPGARSLLTRLHDEGIRLVVATSGSKANVVKLLERAGVQDLVEDTASADDVNASKPEPDVVKAALNKLGADPSGIIMLGDTPYDVEAARRAGVPIIAVRCGGWPDHQLQGAIAIYDDPAALLEHYDESPLSHRGI
jgi:HAD superfamily hydrolase (TIGR01509 family)